MKIRLGYWDKTFAETLHYPAGEAHGLLCSPTRGGKFRDVIAQILLSFEGSRFVIDPKGHAAAVTARYRRDELKQDVYLLNPFKILPDHLGRFHHATYDPVGSKLDPESDTFASDADNLMDGLMPHGGQEVHWIDGARQLGSGIAMHLRQGMDRWSLPHVYESICDRYLYKFCEDAITSRASETDPEDDAPDYVATRLSRFSGKEAADNREIRSVVSTAITRLGFLGNRPIGENMRKSTVDFAQMKHRPMTVYVILPGRYLAPYASWMRTITNAWADSCLQEGKGKLPVLGILDEFKTAVGRLGAIDTLNAMGAGYGCQLLTVIQDLNQLKELYPQSWETSWPIADFRCSSHRGTGPPATTSRA
jgi:type IV secretion system protein VirD4